jgi:hypothetical protein
MLDRPVKPGDDIEGGSLIEKRPTGVFVSAQSVYKAAQEGG